MWRTWGHRYGGPKDHIDIKISHAGSNARSKGSFRNCDPSVYVVFLAPKVGVQDVVHFKTTQSVPMAPCNFTGDTWALKDLPYHDFGVYVYTIKLHGAFGCTTPV